MRFKSWYLILVGIVLQMIFGMFILSIAKTTNDVGGFFMGILGSFILIASGIGVIPLILVYFSRTRRIGGVISILFGIFGILIQIGIVVGIFLIGAGILSLWKKI